MAHAGGWLSRTEGIIEAAGIECAAVGYLLIPALLGALEDGDASGARTMAVRATEIGNRFDDPDLRAFGTLAHGQALLAMGDSAAGIARLDNVMVSVTVGEVGPITSGIVYCAVVLECIRLFDFARAAEWTNALSTWCDAQPDLVPYRGQCLVHRSQLQQASGDWQRRDHDDRVGASAPHRSSASCARLGLLPRGRATSAHWCIQRGRIRVPAGEPPRVSTGAWRCAARVRSGRHQRRGCNDSPRAPGNPQLARTTCAPRRDR